MTFDGDAYGNRTFEFIEKLKRLDDYDAICGAVAAEIQWFGFQHVTGWSMPGPGADQAACLLLNTRPQEYIERYIEKNYVIHDPVVTELRNTLEPFSWNDLRARRALSKFEKSIMDEGRAFGALNGFIVPVVAPSGAVAVFSPCGAEPDLPGRAKAALEIVGIYAVEALKQALGQTPPAETPRARLTPREREVMRWVAAGRSDDEIAKILSVSARTVTWHVENAKRKLDAYRRPYAVVQALRLGEIQL